ncbi:TIGR03086 family metal-binding protein [Kitasatospora sp. NBC_00240]|uniref:TIGR03086 family metal-binding protein n=1 Tax=Kitasatospora sp. NBC_00240 TaxID=2903567 RepID=UPI0022547D15|nr:TIGR03086 family metal-binding protein [Kitasatospora sp. NBC_00240]MCX5214260.1 TIGR03086 family metal-binding protein [Kitasatospora sp. NBC_00240]
MSASPWPVLDQAHQALRTAVAGVPSDGWQRPTPAGRWTVAQVLQHVAADQLAYAARLTGGPGPDHDPFDLSGIIEGSPAELLEAALAASAAAFAAVDPADDQVPVPLPPYTLPAARAVAAAALDAAVHAWDIAVATGRPSPLTPALAKALRPVTDDVVEPLRGYVYASPIEPAAGADEADALLNHLGRRADWSG